MSAFFARFKGLPDASAPATGHTPTKKDPNAPQPTPLEKLLAEYPGPVRTDGSDKFFGFENFGSTCYCNSIIQCLYYSVPFREQVINFPRRSAPDTILDALAKAPPRIITDVGAAANGQNNALSPSKTKPGAPAAKAPQKPGLSPGGPGAPGQRPEDNKDSPEYKKKQAMTAGPILNMDYENSESYGMNTSLFTSLKDIFEAIIAHQSRTGVVSPNKFLEILRRENEMFRTAMHQDAHEFLNLLLNEVVENVEQFSKQLAASSSSNGSAISAMAAAISSTVSSAPSIKSSGWIHELFEGTLTSETRCLTCENTSQRDEAFLDLSVDLEQHSSVTSCLRKFSEEEMLCERNKFHCDKCGGLQEAEKRMKIKRLPRILALHLKRFKYTEDLRRLQKLFHRVVYPYYLRLFNTTDDAEDPDRLYELYAVVVHIGGGPYHGHYVSIIKTQDRGWLLFDDEMVEPVDKAYVRNFFGGENVLACAYVLFYQETTFEAMQKEQEAEAAAAAKASEAADVAGGIKVNGHSNGHGNGFAANGVHTTTPITPTTEDPDHFANLDHAATAPGPPHSPPAIHVPANHTEHPLEPVVSSPVVISKAERKAQEKERKAQEKALEKERKAQEKEQERLAQAKRKELEKKRIETYRKQEEELRAAIAASKVTKAEEDKKEKSDKAGSSGEKEKENGHGSIGGLSRFRQSSMSLRHKPKLWGSKEKGGGSVVDEEGNGGALSDKEKDKEKGKNRFSLGRKKSTLGF